MDLLGGKLFGRVKRGNVPVFDIDSPWKKKILHNATYFKYEPVYSVSATFDALKTTMGTFKSDCDLQLFKYSFEYEFRHGKMFNDISLPCHGVYEDKETLTDPVITEEERNISYYANNCEKLEKKVIELTTEKDKEKNLRQESEFVFKIMQQEYFRVISLKTQQIQAMFEQTINEKMIELKLISNKLDKVEIERDDFQKQLSDQNCCKSNMVENHDKMLQSLYDEKTVMRNQFEAKLSEIMTENIALKVETSDLKLKVEHLNVVKKKYHEDLHIKDISLKNQMKLLKSKEETINTLNNEKKLLENNFELSVKELAAVKGSVHKKEVKIQKELGILLSNLQKETKTVKDHENFIEFLNNRYRIMLHSSNALLNKEKTHKFKVSKMKTQIDELILIKNNQDNELQKQDRVFQKNNLKIKNDLQELLLNLQKESIDVQKYEQMIDHFNNDIYTTLGKMKTENNLLKVETSHLRQEIGKLSSVENYQKELLKSQEETIFTLNNEKKLMQNNFEISVQKLAAVKGSVHKKNLKIQKELGILLSNLRIETKTVKDHEHFIESLNNRYMIMQHSSNALLNEKNTHKFEVSKMKTQIDELILVKNNLDKELQTKHNFFQKNNFEIKKELQELLMNLQKESINVQKYEQMIDHFNNDIYTTLGEMKTQYNLFNVETSDLKQEIGKLCSVNNYVHKDLETRDNQTACLKTDVLFLRNDLELALEMVKVLTTGNTEPTNSQVEHTHCKQVIDKKNVTLLEMENMVVNKLTQKTETIQANLNSNEYEIEAIRIGNQKTDTIERNDIDESSLSIYYEDISNVSDEKRVELATLKREILEQKQRTDKMRKTCDQEKHQLHASIRLDQQKNEQILATIEGKVLNLEQQLTKPVAQDETHKNKEMMNLISESAIFVETIETNMMSQSDQSADTIVSSQSGKQ